MRRVNLKNRFFDPVKNKLQVFETEPTNNTYINMFGRDLSKFIFNHKKILIIDTTVPSSPVEINPDIPNHLPVRQQI